MTNLTRRDLLATAAAGAAFSSLPTGIAAMAVTPAAAPADAALNQALDKLTEALLQDDPEGATQLGVDKGARADLKSKVTDRSWAHVAKDPIFCTAWLKRLGNISDQGLSKPAKLNKAVVGYALALGRDGGQFAFGDNTLAAAMGEQATPMS